MFRNSSRLRQERKQTSQNLHSTDLADFPSDRVHGNFIMWDENKKCYVTSGKDAVTTIELNAAIDNLIGEKDGTSDSIAVSGNSGRIGRAIACPDEGCGLAPCLR